MTQHTNAFGQPVGFPLPDWTARPQPPRTAMAGRFCRIEPLDPERHAAELHAANQQGGSPGDWTYLPYGPFAGLAEYDAWLRARCCGDDPLFHAIIDPRSGRAVGVASYQRINAAAGVLELGHIKFSPALQRTPAATEAMFLLLQRAFDELGYRRCEWKCDTLNAPSRAAAERLGFRFEGVFRQATVYRQRSRDTAWLSMLDSEWRRYKPAYQRWLAPANFDAAGQQRRRLGQLLADA